MGSKTGVGAVRPLGVLATIERQYPIDQGQLESVLRQARAEQDEVDAVTAPFAQSAHDWNAVTRKLQLRQRQTLAAIDRVVEALGESRFDEVAREFLRARMGYLRALFAQMYQTRISLSKILASLARLGAPRGRGRPSQNIVNDCLRSLVNELTSRERRSAPVPKETALRYVGALAQVVGIMPESLAGPGGAVRRRLSKHKGRGPTKRGLDEMVAQLNQLAFADWPEPETTTTKAVHIAEQIAEFGRWPEAFVLKTVRPPKDGSEPRIRRPRLEDPAHLSFRHLEEDLMRLAKSGEI